MYRVAVLQFQPEFKNVATNLIRLENWCSQITADLLVLPELATTGYAFSNKEELETLAESIPEGKAFCLFKSIAYQRQCSIVYGFAEKYQDKIYNSALLINPDGSYYIYRKTHLFWNEKKLFDAGDTGFFVCRAKGGVPIGMMICFDWQFPEAARCLAIQGAQIICHPSNLVLPWCQQAMITRSFENKVFSITANRIGFEYFEDKMIQFTGQSQILNPHGEVLLRLSNNKEEVGLAEINPIDAEDKSVTPMNHAFTDRRPAFYTTLLSSKKINR